MPDLTELNQLQNEVNRLLEENARLKVHPEGFSAETMQSMTDELKRLRDAADNVNCERDMAEAAFKDANAEVERLRAENASLTDEVDHLRVNLAKAVAALENYRYQHEKDLGMTCHCPPCMVARQTLKEITCPE